MDELAREAGLMAKLRHPNIVMFLGAVLDPPCMVTEFCARGSLLDVLHRARTNEVCHPPTHQRSPVSKTSSHRRTSSRLRSAITDLQLRCNRLVNVDDVRYPHFNLSSQNLGVVESRGVMQLDSPGESELFFRDTLRGAAQTIGPAIVARQNPQGRPELHCITVWSEW